ncbi:MAG TPA: DUF480 domain-containing protein [Phycisphaerales bacterium]|nr:DUF480 domain-containing protein [Phycisphaerales bacterium]HRQ76544.1 DUF480 domain-containing protein [Phycisphaerales bacterium]
MIALTPNECRVLGVLVEKALTTPAQYPMTLNAIVNGCNQKNNRDPVLNLDEEATFDALEGLRNKGLAREVIMTGSRVEKYRHVAKEALETDTAGLVVLVELLLRGPQTVGEIRGRASRMHPLESIEAVEQALSHLINRDKPLVKELPPSPGTRAARFAQLLCPTLHPLDAPATSSHHAGTGAAHQQDQLVERVEQLEQDVSRLRDAIARLAASLGEANPFAGTNH